MATTSDTERPMTTTTHGSTTTGSGQRPSEKQLAALRKFNCQIPPGIDRAECSEWLDWIIGKLKRNERLTDDDLAGPPVIRPAIDYSGSGGVNSAHRTASPPARPSTDVPEPEGPTEAPGALSEPLVFLPDGEAWATAEYEISVDAEGKVTGRRVFVRVSGHGSPGESWEQVVDRFGAIAGAEATKLVRKA